MSNIVGVCVGDHRTHGRGDGRLGGPEAARRRLRAWKRELGAEIVHWREVRSLAEEFRYFRRGVPPFRFSGIPWDDLALVPQFAHDMGMRAFLHVTIFDEGATLRERLRVGEDLAWQSDFSRTHPEYAVVDRRGRRQSGVLCLAYPAVRRYFLDRIERRFEEGDWDGVFVCLRSQSRPADFGDQYGYNPPVMKDYRHRYGSWFDLRKWRDLLGSYVTLFLRELKHRIPRVAVGVPRGDVLGPPLGNATLEWREWEGLLDHRVINQNSTRCPAQGHSLWPRCSGKGYVQDYRTGKGLPPLWKELDARRPVYIARQWASRSAGEEKKLLSHPNVKGLVFSSFRHDMIK